MFSITFLVHVTQEEEHPQEIDYRSAVKQYTEIYTSLFGHEPEHRVDFVLSSEEMISVWVISDRMNLTAFSDTKRNPNGGFFTRYGVRGELSGDSYWSNVTEVTHDNIVHKETAIEFLTLAASRALLLEFTGE